MGQTVLGEAMKNSEEEARGKSSVCATGNNELVFRPESTRPSTCARVNLLNPTRNARFR